MKTIRVVSSSSVDNASTYELFRQLIEERGLEVRLEKARIIAGLQGAGVMEEAGIIIDGERVHDGIPGRSEVEAWLDSVEAEPCCGFCGGQGRAFLKSVREKTDSGA